ncbi:MAG: tetraacyldisaccharide 4'-kinase [Elusimicrobiota bacterium]
MSAESMRKRLRETALGRLTLTILMLLYGLGVSIRNLLYDIGALPAKRLKARIICIGNLTTGGTGKTPAVLLAAITLRQHQIKTAILTRGYKSKPKKHEVQVLLNTKNVYWQETGDEPWMMHRALKGFEVPILVHADRYRAGEAALTYYDPEVLLLDDGFQHRRLKRDLDIVLINALDPFGGEKLLPSGNLREPLSALKRAGLVVITHADQIPKRLLKRIRETILRVHPEVRVLESVHRADFLFDLREDRRRRLAYLKNKTVACFSAIGDPGAFEALLQHTGARIVQCWRFADHHPFTREEIQSIENVRGGAPVVTTLKDFARLPPGWQDILSGDVLALSIKLEITKGKSIWEEAICNEPAAAS